MRLLLVLILDSCAWAQGSFSGDLPTTSSVGVALSTTGVMLVPNGCIIGYQEPRYRSYTVIGERQCGCSETKLGRVHLMSPCERHEKAVLAVIKAAQRITKVVWVPGGGDAERMCSPYNLTVPVCNCRWESAGDGVLAAICKAHLAGVEEAMK